MAVVLGLLIVGAVLTLTAVVVLFALAAEAEVLPALTRGDGLRADESSAASTARGGVLARAGSRVAQGN
jgi:hypothetical protein